MPKVVIPEVVVLDKLVGSELGFYDSYDPQWKPVVAVKVVDITAFCPKAIQAVLKYAQTANGPLVQLNHWREKGKDGGECTYYFYEKKGQKELADAVFFQMFANWWGIEPQELARLVFEHAP